MVAFISLLQAKADLRIDGDEQDLDIQMKVEAASEIVLDYIKRPTADWTDSTAPALIKAATILVLRSLFNDDEADPLSDAVIRILFRYRDPALA